jgi:hypothetical protein
MELSPSYYVEDSHPAIISKDLFHRIQEEKARRASLKKFADKRVKTDSGKYSSKYALTELLICGECGKPYRRHPGQHTARKGLSGGALTGWSMGKNTAKSPNH